MDEQRSAASRLTLTEAARYLGLSPSTLYQWRWLNDGTGPASYRIRNRVFYDRSDLDSWIDQQKENTLK